MVGTLAQVDGAGRWMAAQQPGDRLPRPGPERADVPAAAQPRDDDLGRPVGVDVGDPDAQAAAAGAGPGRSEAPQARAVRAEREHVAVAAQREVGEVAAVEVAHGEPHAAAHAQARVQLRDALARVVEDRHGGAAAWAAGGRDLGPAVAVHVAGGDAYA